MGPEPESSGKRDIQGVTLGEDEALQWGRSPKAPENHGLYLNGYMQPLCFNGAGARKLRKTACSKPPINKGLVAVFARGPVT